jgi:hypothetical protein
MASPERKLLDECRRGHAGGEGGVMDAREQVSVGSAPAAKERVGALQHSAARWGERSAFRRLALLADGPALAGLLNVLRGIRDPFIAVDNPY